MQHAEYPPRAYLQSSTLILLAFATAFFSRLLDSAGAPSTINFLHFATVPLACGWALCNTRTKSLRQKTISWMLISGLLILLGVMLLSALVNRAGTINVVLELLLLGEPFLFLLGLVCLPLSAASFVKLQTWLNRFCFANLLIALVQYVLFMILGRHPEAGNPDYVQGVFYHSGSGHVISASVSMTFGLYYLVSAKTVPLSMRLVVVLAALWQMLVADAKQVLLAMLVSGGLLLLTQVKNLGKALKYLLGAVVLGGVVLWCIQNVPAFDAFNTWARPEIYGPEGEATLLKSASVRIISSAHRSPLNWLLGLGPGHTVGRLGGWMINDYWHLLGPLGATAHSVSGEVWQAVGESWLGDQSSMFSPFWGWAGIWGDLGWVGIGAYLYLAWVVWHYLCPDDFSRFLLLNVGVFGLIFTQMEEPGYMLFIAIVVGVRWQKYQLQSLHQRLR